MCLPHQSSVTVWVVVDRKKIDKMGIHKEIIGEKNNLEEKKLHLKDLLNLQEYKLANLPSSLFNLFSAVLNIPGI